MAREWRFSPSQGLPQSDDPDVNNSAEQSLSLDRNWSAARGAVLWEGRADLAGSFPGFTRRGIRAQSVHLTLTDHFLLVDEMSDDGFGLPIGWLSAAHALTGVEPVRLDAGDRLRICYVDGSRVRGFTVRIRGGRFGARANRRANQLRAAVLSLGLASPTPSMGLLLPPEHDLALDWDDFASYEDEPVVWTGQVAMPIGNGLELATCDVWLTDASLIWGAKSRAGIYRISISSVVAITSAATSSQTPVVFWSVEGSRRTLVDLPMVLGQSDRWESDATVPESFLDVLERQGHTISLPPATPQPWLGPVDDVFPLPRPIAGVAVDAVGPEPGDDGVEQPTPVDEMALPLARMSQPIRSQSSDDGLFPERPLASLPTSTPRPWGARVERISTKPASGSSAEAPARFEQRSVRDASTTAEGGEPGRPRIWSPTIARHQHSSERGAAAAYARRLPDRATSTEEFLANEQALRDGERRARQTAAEGQPGTDGATTPTRDRALASRGVIVRFRPPEIAVAGLDQHARGAAELATVESSTSLGGTSREAPRTPLPQRPSGGIDVATLLSETPQAGLVSGDGCLPAPGEAPTSSDADLGSASSEGSGEGVRSVAAETAKVTGEAMEVAAELESCPASLVDQIDTPTLPTGEPKGTPEEFPSAVAATHLDSMRAALSSMDDQLAILVEAVHQVDQPRPALARPVTPSLRVALNALDRGVAAGEIGVRAADTHRQTITRTADTIERLRSLLDLYARGYVTAEEIEERCQALLGRPSGAS
jgi:hypothetical protein